MAIGDGRGGGGLTRRQALGHMLRLLAAALLVPLHGATTRAQARVDSEAAARRDDGPGPGLVQVGVDRCPYCSMSVIDARFAAQQVTVGGRVLVYDAIECLVDHVAGHGGPPLAEGWCFVADHAASTRDQAIVLGVHEALLRHHPRLRTPMGGGLVAFADLEAAEQFVAARGLDGVEALGWDALVERSRERPWIPQL